MYSSLYSSSSKLLELGWFPHHLVLIQADKHLQGYPTNCISPCANTTFCIIFKCFVSEPCNKLAL